MAETVQINLRIKTELAHELEQIAREESLRRTDLARKYLIDGVKRWKLERAIRLYQLGQISLERAALDANLSIYEMMDELRGRGVALDRTTPAQAREEIRVWLEHLVVAKGPSEYSFREKDFDSCAGVEALAGREGAQTG